MEESGVEGRGVLDDKGDGMVGLLGRLYCMQIAKHARYDIII